MKKNILERIRTILAVISGFLALGSYAQEGPYTFEFVENKGQWDERVQFKGELASGSFYIRKDGYTVSLYHPEDLDLLTGHGGVARPRRKGRAGKQVDYRRDLSGVVRDTSFGQGAIVRGHVFAVRFRNASPDARPQPEKQLPSFNNYFLGNDPAKWVSNARIYHSILYRNFYPNIDLRYYSENGKLKYDFIVHPGGDPAQIEMVYEGVNKLALRNGDLLIKTSVGDLKEQYPYSYQPDPVKGRREIACKYVIGQGNTVRFAVSGHDRNSTLVIDPSLIFSSFTGSSANQFGFTATPGPDGSLFSGGIVFSEGFPTTPGAFQRNFAGGTSDYGTDIGIMKFSPNGATRLYATYIGGNSNEYPHSLFSDGAGNLVVMGRSYSNNYPGRTIGTAGGCNIVVTKLNATGSALIGSLRIGGSQNDGLNIEDLQMSSRHGEDRTLLRNYGDDSRSEVILDPAAYIYVAAQTQSTDFPVTPGAFQTSFGGQQDGVVLKIDPTCNNLIWASFLGGTGKDGAFVLERNPLTGEIYVGGGTTSRNFPGVNGSVVQPTFQGDSTDGFVAQISNDGSTLIRATYLGTADPDIIYGLKFDPKGYPYVMGISRGGNWPVINAAYSVPNSAQFVAKLEPDLSAFVFSTVFGSGSRRPNMSPVAFLVDRCENLYISGWGGWISDTEDPYDMAGVAGMPITPDAIQPLTDNRDFYFIVIEKNASGLVYGTYFGQDGGKYGEHVDGGTSRFDQNGVIYQALCANCGGGATFPTTPGVVGRINGALPNGCNLAALKIAFNYAGVASGPRPVVNGVRDTLGCVPFTVTLQDTIRNAVSYIWNFGDGSPDTATTSFEITHTYTSPGTFRVRLIAINLNTCNERDTAYTTVVVREDKVTLDMNFQKLDPCEDLQYRFTNLSTVHPSGRPFNDSSFVWDFGDGTPPEYAGTAPVVHRFAQPGTYVVKLKLVDPGYCNSPDSVTTQIFVSPIVNAAFETPLTGCAPYAAQFTNTSLGGITFEWNFGDGSPISNEVNPMHTYQSPGVYTVRLTAHDPGSCNLVDDTSVVITVSGRPTAAFTHAPVVPVQNTPTVFTNHSTGGVRYKWLFGDGDSVIKTTPDTVAHQYNASGTYRACLITYNELDCTDTACADVQADVLPLLDVPNAFTPGRFGENSVVRVKGFGIARMTWRIYNRWGQKLFETSDPGTGWNGTFNGQLQPMDVYTYTLDVQFVDGTTTRKTGDITLIR